MTPRHIRHIATAAMITVLTATCVTAQEQLEPAPADGGGWTFELSPFLWAANISGDVGIGPVNAPVEVEFSDLVDNLDGGFMLYGRATRGRWSIGLEGVWLKVSSDIAPTDAGIGFAEMDFQQAVVDLQLAYRVIARSDLTADVMLGARYSRLGLDLNSTPNPEGIASTSAALTDEIGRQVRSMGPSALPLIIEQVLGPFGNAAVQAAQSSISGTARSEVNAAVTEGLTAASTQDISETEDWVDPYIGARAQWTFHRSWYALGRGDIGGFGGGSDLVWQVYGGLGTQLAEWAAIELGYRHLEFDYSSGELTTDVAYSGPMLGARFMF